ncbi:MAG: hypothetical protein AB7I79_09260 [Rhizobiaceae bacterium]
MKNDHTTLEDLLGDPMIQLVMKSDGVEADEVRVLFDRPAMRAELPQPYMIHAMHCDGRLCA